MRLCVRMALALGLFAGPPWRPTSPTPTTTPGARRRCPASSPAATGWSRCRAPLPRRRVGVACTPRRVPTPTNAPDDPSYVGSPYGLGKPSYYGFTPPLGIDDPYGRSVLPYCP